MSLDPNAVGSLLEALAATDTAYILGAGASAPEIPVMRDLIRNVTTGFRGKITGFICGNEPTHTHYLFAEQVQDEETRDYLLSASKETLRFLIARELSPNPSVLGTAPEQYDVLALARPGVTIINYNVDGLAATHCPMAKVLAPHGTVPEFVSRLALRGAVFLTDEGLEIVPEGSFWMPEPENEAALLPAIEPAYRSLLGVSSIVVIGYSFGLSSAGVMDRVSYEALRQYWRGRKVRILVVDPAPARLAETLGEELKNLDIVSLPAYWNRLCKAILETWQQQGAACFQELGKWTKEIVRAYERLEG